MAGFAVGRVGNAGDAVLLAYSPAGVEAWVSTYDDPDDNTAVPVGLALVPGGTIYVAGTLDAPTDSESRYLTLGYRPDDTQVFAAAVQLPGAYQSGAADVAVDPATGHAYVTGSARALSSASNVAMNTYSATATASVTSRSAGPAGLSRRARHRRAVALAVLPVTPGRQRLRQQRLPPLTSTRGSSGRLGALHPAYAEPSTSPVVAAVVELARNLTGVPPA